MAVLFPRVDVSLYRAVKTRPGPQDRDIFEVGFTNNGNTDVYIAKLFFRPTDKRLEDERPTSYLIGKSLPAGGVLEDEIPLRTLRNSRVSTVSLDTYESHRDSLEEVGRYRPGCYFIEPNHFDEGRAPTIPQFRIANAVTEIEAFIVYGAAGSRGVSQELKVSSKMTGTLLFWAYCKENDPPSDRFSLN